jgi:adenylosuccinate synthase
MSQPEKKASVVVDLGFGDAGKGLVTDFLVRELGAHTVVRFNGGAQAGHNVVTPDGRHHTFAQLGAGSFVPGVRTFLSRYVVVHPTAPCRGRALAARGVTTVSSADRERERARDDAVPSLRQSRAGARREGTRGAASAWRDRHGLAGVAGAEVCACAISSGPRRSCARCSASRSGSAKSCRRGPRVFRTPVR